MELSEYHKEVARTFPSDEDHTGLDDFRFDELDRAFERMTHPSHCIEIRKKEVFYGRLFNNEEEEQKVVAAHLAAEVARHDLMKQCMSWSRTCPQSRGIAHSLAGIAGEWNEVLVAASRGPLARDELVSEIGDMLFYVTALCNSAGITLQEVMVANVAKLRVRYPEGFSVNRATNPDVEAEQRAMGVASAAG